MAAADLSRDGPPLLRPIPRRPFVRDLKSPTPQSLTPPQDDESDGEEQRLQDEILLASFRRDMLKAGFLNSRPSDDSPPDSPTALTQSHSTANLNSSTLAGIYDYSDHDDVFSSGDELHTPWGTGAETPAKRRHSDNRATYELMRGRSSLPRRRLSYNGARASPPRQPMTPAGAAVWLAPRAAALFFLGAGYGVLVTHLRREQRLLQLPDAGRILPQYEGSYLALCGFGLAGVALGALQPWFDGWWDGLSGPGREDVRAEAPQRQPAAPETDWALVMRAVGVFVGVAFAVRRLAWASSMQLSLAVALASFSLWWLIDRSVPALILSAAVGVAGSVVLLGVNPDMIPTPSTAASAQSNGEIAAVLHGIVSQETIETGLWMLSLLFCTCLCFGNIGRRLARGKAKGRWDRLE
ncbi:insig domain-containing [Trichoderma cornu-damae]|uniref:Insig domain-containing n=1 Tax=Trichoderma cornu-damae TaxID=654480 RepID=A0A9P8QKM6_9HYPO|nr:insig domain-containing [Trichoderma cornu-damae]